MGAFGRKIDFLETTLLAISEYTHYLDPMHITKNVCANTLNTLMNTSGTSKDSLATRLDMQHLGIRKELHPVELENDQFGLPVASWTLKKEKNVCLFISSTNSKPRRATVQTRGD
jgi:hypothetical protein